MATPGQSGSLNATHYSGGTSNSAALASRGAFFFSELLDSLRDDSGSPISGEYSVVLVKALLVHGSDWDTAFWAYEKALKNTQNRRSFREYVSRFLGYGPADFGKVMTCTAQRVTVLGFGALQDGEGAEFALPLPPSLSSVAVRRRVTITLAWMSPINSRRQNYRVAHLWFEPRSDLATERRCADFRSVQRGTVQHEVLEGIDAVDFQEGDEMIVKVNCRNDAGEILAPIRFGLVVTLEVPESLLLPVPIYDEVRQRLAVRIRQTVESP